MESEADGGGATLVADEGAGALEADAGAAARARGADAQVRPGDLAGPRGPGEAGAAGGPAARPPRDPDDPDDHGDTGDRVGPGVAGQAGAAVGGVPRMERAPGPGRNAAPVAGGRVNRQVQFTLSVPFPSPEKAELASLILTPNVQRRGPVQKEISVNGNVLTV
ncbi:PREDICTED: EKC/KEOPS complex subunit LAGE3-like [Galeopterus variegatus]|uniref:EKC/KEOPS complex subunit LAGE3-like n=1 Tax=Galeopterus variegatus TaxID=482537 RepID=A0ABM0SGK7_GALVR|nr:PREDICTED: EKC/KEOPS complex subunit LAGE3-like [Galeopterus variegatus]